MSVICLSALCFPLWHFTMKMKGGGGDETAGWSEKGVRGWVGGWRGDRGGGGGGGSVYFQCASCYIYSQ